MIKRINRYRWLLVLLLCIGQAVATEVHAQRALKHREGKMKTDSLSAVKADSLSAVKADSLPPLSKQIADSLDAMPRQEVNLGKKFFTPNPTTATWLAVVFPGGGQIYNRKYWKLPIIYGGFAGCAYALSWNGKMYKDYAQAYRDIMDDNPNTKSYEDLMPVGATYNVEQLKTTLKRRKDSFRRYRDLSIFAFIGVYIVSIIDAYVDAELSNFDISPDLSMNNRSMGMQFVFRF